MSSPLADQNPNTREDHGFWAECSHRAEASKVTARCRLVQRLAEQQTSELCEITPDICAACSKLVKPTESRPNAVVASLAHAALAEVSRTADDAVDAVKATERLVWVEQFLDDAATSKIETASTPTHKNARRQDQILRRRWAKLLGGAPRIGLAGFNNTKGLGHLNRDLVRQLGIDDWLLIGGGKNEYLSAQRIARRVRWVNRPLANSDQDVERFLESIDVLIFAEDPVLEQLPMRARSRGIPVVCVPMWERLHPALRWLPNIDLMLCPTRITYQMMLQWRHRFGFAWRIEHCPWPIDTAGFPFRVRNRCERFLYINGTDAAHPRDRSGTATPTRRKGLETLLAAARQLAHIPFIIWSQVELPRLPRNVQLRLSAPDHLNLYTDADVCVQLSRWEGLGLPLLECQAAGMPLITIDAPPMNEHNPLAMVSIAGHEVLQLLPRRWIAAPLVDANEVTATLVYWYGRDITQFSRDARRYVDQTHTWDNSRHWLKSCLRELVDSHVRAR